MIAFTSKIKGLFTTRKEINMADISWNEKFHLSIYAVKSLRFQQSFS